MSSKNIFEELKVLTSSLPVESLVKSAQPANNHSFAAWSVFSIKPKEDQKVERTPENISNVKEFIPKATDVEWIVETAETDDYTSARVLSEETFKSWREMIFQSPISADQFEKARQSREYWYIM